MRLIAFSKLIFSHFAVFSCLVSFYLASKGRAAGSATDLIVVHADVNTPRALCLLPASVSAFHQLNVTTGRVSVMIAASKY